MCARVSACVRGCDEQLKRKLRDTKRQNADKLRKRGSGGAAVRGKAAPTAKKSAPAKKAKPAAKKAPAARVVSDDDDDDGEADAGAASRAGADADEAVGTRILRNRKPTRKSGRSSSLSDDDESDYDDKKASSGTKAKKTVRVGCGGVDVDVSVRVPPMFPCRV